MNLQEAKKLLRTTERGELRDHAFGDAEVYWEKDGQTIASGYFGSRSGVTVYDNTTSVPTTAAHFEGKEAKELRECGKLTGVERNDETGPANYQEGTCMPGLTLEGVRQELCTKPIDDDE